MSKVSHFSANMLYFPEPEAPAGLVRGLKRRCVMHKNMKEQVLFRGNPLRLREVVSKSAVSMKGAFDGAKQNNYHR